MLVKLQCKLIFDQNNAKYSHSIILLNLRVNYQSHASEEELSTIAKILTPISVPRKGAHFG